jgi:glucosyl-dolichyl phosphate glucuronosyltransferase
LSSIEITVAICTYNRERYLPQLFQSILDQTLAPERFEIVLIDNNSPGNTRELFNDFTSNHPSYRTHYALETNQGLSFARNRAIKEAKAPLITFLDDDAFIDKNYLSVLVEGFKQHPECGSIGGPIYLHYEDIKPKWENLYLNSLLGYFNKGSDPFYFNRTDYPRGSNMAFRMLVFERAGLFNVALGRIGNNLFGGEEKDQYNRIYEAEIPVLYEPQAIVHHCVPKERTTFAFIKKQALGTGVSERLRSKNEGLVRYLQRIVVEGIKWCGSIVLWFIFAFKLQFAKGNMILFFRFWVTRGLLFKYDKA